MFIGPIFSCFACDIVFTQPKVTYWQGRQELICPQPGCEATQMDFDEMPEEEIWLIFNDILGANFTEVRRMNLRMIAETGMTPYNPISRLL